MQRTDFSHPTHVPPAGGDVDGLVSHSEIDHATLCAALAFADECQLSDTDEVLVLLSPVAVRNGGTVHPNDDARSSLSPVARSARMRKRDELLYLRDVVNKLEMQLTTLKTRGNESTKTVKEPLVFVWEELASRQYKQRQRAEVENVKLREMLDEQIRVIKNLERVLKRRTMAEIYLPSTTKRVRQSSMLDSLSVFDDLRRMISDMYTQVDSIFADKRFACTKPTISAHQTRSDDEHGPVIEVFDSRISPFDIDSVSDAIWHHMSMQSFDRQALHYELLEFSDKTFRLEYESTLEVPRLKGTFHGKIAGQKIVQNDRILLLWAALVDPDQVSGTPMDGVLMRQKGWTMIRQAPPPYAQSDQPVSVAQMYHIIIPEFNENDNIDEQRRKVGTLTNFVSSTVDFHLEVGRSMIENLLLDDGWKNSSIRSSPVSENDAAVTNKTG